MEETGMSVKECVRLEGQVGLQRRKAEKQSAHSQVVVSPTQPLPAHTSTLFSFCKMRQR